VITGLSVERVADRRGVSRRARAADRRPFALRLPHAAATGALILLLLVAVQVSAWAQARGAAGSQSEPPQRVLNPKGVRVFIWTGLKTHGAGLHDYPLFLAEWSSVLNEQGAVVDGALHFPSSADLAQTDVLVIYKGDAAYMNDSQKATLEAFVRRGGGMVILHDSECGPDPDYYSTMVGGAKKHGESNSASGKLTYKVVDKSHPIMKDLSDMTLDEEAFYLMTWAKDPPIHPLVTVQLPDTPRVGEHKGEVIPQLWIYEHTLPGGTPARVFVSMQGHSNTTFNLPPVKRTLLRGIAWAGKRPVDELVDYVAPARPARRGAPEGGGAPAPGGPR
jgi:type 1 glutamine amidotransferase